jgi:hypothetical protein
MEIIFCMVTGILLLTLIRLDIQPQRIERTRAMQRARMKRV